MPASTHIARLATAVLAVVAAMLLATTVSAVAQTSCEGRVLDTACQLSSADVADLTELTEELSAAGVKPFVRLLPTTESGIDAWLATSEAQCQAWRDADRRDPDLLVLAEGPASCGSTSPSLPRFSSAASTPMAANPDGSGVF